MFDIKEEPLTTRHKGTRTLHTKKIPIFDTNGEAQYLLGISEDITEKLKTEDMLVRSQKMEAVGQMSGGIAHDFNNQLGVIIGYTELLSEQSLSDSQMKWLEAVRIAAERCAELTQQLLIFSRHGEVDKEIVNVNEVISGMEVMIQRSLTPEVQIKYFLADRLWSTEVNLGGCKDLILNLVLNARDAMPDGGSLTIETSNIVMNETSALAMTNVTAGEYVQIMVSDTGKGMSKEVYEHVFEPFYTTKDVGKGTGLGLSMVYGFVRRYGGDIVLDTEPDNGATFRIYLPRSIEEASKSSASSIEKSIYPTGSENILVVDDEESLLNYAEQLIKSWGYNVYCARNAADALSILENTSIDLLFTDLVMPGGISGYELAEEAHKQNLKLKVLVTSGFADKADGSGKKEFELLAKPYGRGDLAEKLRKILDE